METAEEARSELHSQLEEHSKQMEALGNENWELLQQIQKKEKEWKTEKASLADKIQQQSHELKEEETAVHREKIAEFTELIAILKEQQANSSSQLNKVHNNYLQVQRSYSKWLYLIRHVQ